MEDAREGEFKTFVRRLLRSFRQEKAEHLNEDSGTRGNGGKRCSQPGPLPFLTGAGQGTEV